MIKWFGFLKNKYAVNETNSTWNSVQNNLSSLSINNNGQIITLPPNLSYIQGKSASMEISNSQTNQNSQIDSRYIGFILGNNIVKIRIKNDNNIDVEIENVPTKNNNTK